MEDQPLKPLFDKVAALENQAKAQLSGVDIQRKRLADDLEAFEGLIGLLLQLDPSLDPARAEQMAEAAAAEGVPGWAKPEGASAGPEAMAFGGLLEAFNRHVDGPAIPTGPTAPPLAADQPPTPAEPAAEWTADGWHLSRNNAEPEAGA